MHLIPPRTSSEYLRTYERHVRPSQLECTYFPHSGAYPPCRDRDVRDSRVESVSGLLGLRHCRPYQLPFFRFAAGIVVRPEGTPVPGVGSGSISSEHKEMVNQAVVHIDAKG